MASGAAALPMAAMAQDGTSVTLGQLPSAQIPQVPPAVVPDSHPPIDRAPQPRIEVPQEALPARPQTREQQDAGPAAPREAPAKFMIAAIDVSGVSKLDNAEIEKLIYPYLGPDRTNEDVIAAQKALQDAYARKGFEAVEVEIPVQPNDTFAQGIVQLVVHETPLGKVQVVDAKHHSPEVARAQVPSLVEGQPINIASLQSDIAEANRFPDRQISPKFKPGATPGTVDVDLQVEDQSPVHASVELNNDNSPNTEPLRLSGTVRYSNLWGAGHTLSVTSSLAPQDTKQSAVVSASYNAPLFGTPWSFLVYGYKSNSNVAALGGTNVLGNGYQIGLRATYRLPGDKVFQQISFGPDFKSFKENISLDGRPLQPTKINYLPLVAEYALSGADDESTFGLTLGATAGLRVIKRDACFENPFDGPPPPGVLTCQLGSDVGVIADQFTGRAINASENFVHFNLDLNYTRTLDKDFQVALRFSGQLADSSLVTNEQFSIGGMSNVRGYYVSEAVGDDGFSSSIELRTPDWGPSIGSIVDSFRLFTFLDAGYARVRAPATGQQDEFRLAGAGGGLRLQLFKLVTGEFVIGVPLRRGPITDRGDPRYSFSLKGEF
ncbi:ShlB/FhaC/HecB family hemolysin secretion/activation protein [Sphingomonas sp. dw_22]|uniref:ShlB/FhaC/HecB family hemolysin secretion/activation protein n=1 Tax=Sphingomonas sp. dw_22 TaxID=2721175 RepID=UPI002116CD73|nr:ShlB/FhaC/HecB family hemolysin secretion/activation protein [Sphingomonas sp. dw_22]